MPDVQWDSPESVPAAAALMREGFVPLERFPPTLSRVWEGWPTEHQAAVVDTRTWPDDDAPPDPEPSPKMRLLRTPWPNTSVEQVLAAAYQLVTRFADWERNQARAVEVVRDLLASGEQEVLRLWREGVAADQAEEQ